MDTEQSRSTSEAPFMRLLCIINRKWTILTIVAIGNYDGVRFNDLKRELEGVSPKTLSETIRELDNMGVVQTVKTPGPPLRIQYFLTEDGHELRKSILPALEWIFNKSSMCDSSAVMNALEKMQNLRE